ncbi:MAG: hypothetical protein AAF648_10665 [Pseudomonadota bacterium]
MRGLTFLIFGLALLATVATAETEPPSDDTQTLTPAFAAWARLASLELPIETPLPFEEVVESRMFKAPQRAEGVLWIDDAGRFTMAIDDPKLEQRVVTHDALILRRPRRGSVTVNDAEPAAASTDWVERRLSIDDQRPLAIFLASLRRLLDADVSALKQQFRVDQVTGLGVREDAESATAADAAVRSWQIRLCPQDERLAKRLPAVELAGEAATLLSIAADRGRRGRQTVRLLSASGR